jgi:hypothetical protein
MSRTRRYRSTDNRQRRREYRTPRQVPQRSRLQRAQCCGAMIAADPARMHGNWADVHEPGCRVPWEALPPDVRDDGGEPRDVYPFAPWLPPAGLRLTAVNRRPGARPANPDHAAPVRRRTA